MSNVSPFLPYLLKGLLVTVEVTVLGLLLALPVAFAAGLGRLSKHRSARWAAGTFIETFRGTSVVVQLFWFFFALPILGLPLSPMTAAVLALGLNAGAYAAEVVRGAILAVPKGQREAAVALNMTPWMQMRRVILPQAIPTMIPSFCNVSVDLLKATSLVSLVTVSDVTFRAQTVRSSTGETAIIFGLILVMYFVLAMLIAWGARWLENRTRVEGPRSGPVDLATAARGEMVAR